MTLSGDFMFFLPSFALGFNTSLSPILAPQADTLVILLPIVFPTLLTFAPRLLITTQLTWLACNFMNIITFLRHLVLSCFLSLIVFFIISRTTLCRFTIRLMPLAHNQTQPSAIEYFIVSSRALSSLLHESSHL